MKGKIKTSLIIILSVGLLISVYFLMNKQKNKEADNTETQREEFLFSRMEECRRIGTILYNKDKEELGESGVLINPEYTYNEGLNTCLYFSGYLGRNAVWEKWVKDSLTNKEILYLTLSNGEIVPPSIYCDVCVSSAEEFNRRKVELFGQ